MSSSAYTCPCCGYITLDERPGSYDICHVCFWEDDPVQILDPWFAGGANKPSLVESQNNYLSFGAMEQRFTSEVKGVLAGDVRDKQWRVVMESDRAFVSTPAELADTQNADPGVWYYWRRPLA